MGLMSEPMREALEAGVRAFKARSPRMMKEAADLAEAALAAPSDQRLTFAEALLREIRTTLALQPDMIRSDTMERGDGELGEFIGRINRLLGDQKVGCPDCNGYIGYSHADDCPRNGE